MVHLAYFNVHDPFLVAVIVEDYVKNSSRKCGELNYRLCTLKKSLPGLPSHGRRYVI